jgi:hypothetical protein
MPSECVRRYAPEADDAEDMCSLDDGWNMRGFDDLEGRAVPRSPSPNVPKRSHLRALQRQVLHANWMAEIRSDDCARSTQIGPDDRPRP